MQNRWQWFLIGLAAGPLLLGLAAYAFLVVRSDGFGTRTKPPWLEAAIARRLRRAAIPSAATSLKNPVSNSAEVLAEAREHWADHCAGCHANDGSGDIPMGKQMYPPAPDMRLPATQQLSDGELFYIIENGIRHTGMPAWGAPDRSQPGAVEASVTGVDTWKLVYFIRHLPQITAQERLDMEKMNPKSPSEIKEEQEEEEFLKGNPSHEHTTEHHH